MNALSKNSSDKEIKVYFLAVAELAKSNEEFPVDLNMVWPLVYGQKSDAVSALKKDFIENVDFQSLRENPQRGAASPIIYKLSLSCMEFFIARKIRPVFEIYRQVLHRVAKPLSSAEMFLQNAQLMVEHETRISNVEDRVMELEARADTAIRTFTVLGYATLHKIKIGLQLASKLGKQATVICKQRGYIIESVPDPRFGKANVYPVEVLDEVFNQDIN